MGLKQIFPLSYKKKSSVTDLVVHIVIYIVVAAIISVLMGVLSFVPGLNIVLWILGGLIDLYVFIGLILLIVDYVGK